MGQVTGLVESYAEVRDVPTKKGIQKFLFLFRNRNDESPVRVGLGWARLILKHIADLEDFFERYADKT